MKRGDGLSDTNGTNNSCISQPFACFNFSFTQKLLSYCVDYECIRGNDNNDMERKTVILAVFYFPQARIILIFINLILLENQINQSV